MTLYMDDMTNTVRNISALCALLLLTSPLVGCQSLAQHQGGVFPTGAQASPALNGYEAEGMVDARTFLGADLMASDLYRVAPQAWNDGSANTYKIETSQHVYIVQGTALAKTRIAEIYATDILRHQSTSAKAGKAVVERTVNLVETPIRAIKGIADRFGKARNTSDVLMVTPKSAGEIVGGLAKGAVEFGVTGLRLVTGATGTKCQGIDGCIDKAGHDIWSGVNSLVGKHAAAKEIHQSLGTDPYSENRVLQRQVNRLAYADAYTSTAVKFGYTYSGVKYLDPLATGVGYYNNGEFIITYEDAYRGRNLEKKMLRSWGLDEDTVTALYKSEAFTHHTRTDLVQAVSTFGTNAYKTRMIQEAASAPSRFAVQSRLAVLQYLAQRAKQGQIKAFVADMPTTVAIDGDGRLVLPLAVDYLKWTPEIATVVQSLAKKAGSSKAFSRADIHVLGTASPLFKQKASALGVGVLEIAQ